MSTITIKSLSEILDKIGGKITLFFIWNGKVLFVRVLIDGEHLLIYIPSSYTCILDESLENKKEVFMITPTKPGELEMKIEEVFKPIILKHDTEDLIWKHYTQLEKFKTCTLYVPYKFSIVGKNT